MAKTTIEFSDIQLDLIERAVNDLKDKFERNKDHIKLDLEHVSIDTIEGNIDDILFEIETAKKELRF